MQPSIQPTKFIPALEGLRGIAIIAVIIYHNFPYGDSLFGWLGVDLFFVLSGFLITGILLRSVNIDSTTGYFKKFYIRRALRIFPLYYLFLFAFLFLFPTLGIINNNEVSEYQDDKFWFIFYAQNWLFTNNFPENSHCLNHFWSLAVEEQYYIFWPIIIILLRKPKYLLIFLAGFLIFLFGFRSFIWNAQFEGFNYTNFYTFTRFDGICIGSIIAILSIQRKEFILRHTAAIVTGLAALNFIFYFANTSGKLPYLAFIGYTTFAAMFGILVYELAYGNSKWLKNIFNGSAIRYLGRISYGLYMFHWPVHYFLRKPLYTYFNDSLYIPTVFNQILIAFITTSISILFSLISYHFFEMKFLRLKENFK